MYIWLYLMGFFVEWVILVVVVFRLVVVLIMFIGIEF